MNFKLWLGAAFVLSEAVYYFFGSGPGAKIAPEDIARIPKRQHFTSTQAQPQPVPNETPKPTTIIVAPAKDGSLKSRWD